MACFPCDAENGSNFFLNGINSLFFVMGTNCAYYEVGADFICDMHEFGASRRQSLILLLSAQPNFSSFSEVTRYLAMVFVLLHQSPKKELL